MNGSTDVADWVSLAIEKENLRIRHALGFLNRICAVGRGRGKVAIGVHDLDTVTPPFRYLASERTRSFVPLDYDRPMTMEEILTGHPKGRDYAHLVRDLPRFPLIVDSRDEVLSVPPIINGELTRVTSRLSPGVAIAGKFRSSG